MNYEYGPDFDFYITAVDDFKRCNGSYSDMSKNDQYVLQTICHMLYQIDDDIFPGFTDFGESYLLKVDGYNTSYSLLTADGMTIFSVTKTGNYSYDFEFLSPNRFRMQTNGFFDYVTEHTTIFGKKR